MTAAEMAALHALAFAGQGRAWPEAEIAALLGDPLVFAVTRPGGFALGRAVAGEAELLTLATDPARRRQGLGRALLGAFEEEAARRGAQEVFLEVAEDNSAAWALYRAAGYAETGRRRGYYRRDGAVPADALILRRTLG